VKVKDAIALLRSPLGRLVAATVGVVGVSLLLRHVGPAAVLHTIQSGAGYLPLALALEGGILTCTLLALRELYGPDRHHLTPGILARAGLLGYVAMSLVPAGRTVAEALRATILSRNTSGPRAAVAALQLQGCALLANAAASTCDAVVTFMSLGATPGGAAIGVNALLTLLAGLLILLGSRASRMGHHMGRLWPKIQAFGKGFDEHMSLSEALPIRSILWECGGRLLQATQYAILLRAVGGVFSLRGGFIAQGIHLVATTAGDLIPAQLGATEANFALFARTLSLPASGGVAIALMAHLVQLFWVLVGILAWTLWPASKGGGSPNPLQATTESLERPA
jgi:hypothetical protein